MSDKKVFNIDPNLFNFSKTNTTRKRKEKPDKDTKIQMKSPKKTTKKETLRSRSSLLKMIRNHQENMYNNKFTNGNNSVVAESKNDVVKDAEDFFKNLEDRQISKQNKNYTLKQQPTYTDSNTIQNINSTPISDITSSIIPSNNSITINPSTSNIVTPPKYGCLKNGNLPTYRSYMNQTRKREPTNIIEQSAGNQERKENIINNNQNISNNSSNMLSNNNLRSLEQSQIKNKLDLRNENRKHKFKKKRKKTLRRTYKIGRSKIKPKISVLVSNKTIRNNITTKKQLLKQVPIQDIKTYLIKHGFIRIGSITPNDVLRKMYESAMLICGEVNNYNSDNLLYNFLNDKEEF
jgi:hypothetical protein